MTDLPVDTLLTVDQAIAILDAVQLQPNIIQCSLSDALGLRLAEDIFSDSDYPPFDKAVMDGFAVRSADAIAGAKLTVVETIAAGSTGQRSVGPGEAAAIMTGAPLPAGADAVVPVEQTSRSGDHVILNNAVKPNQAIARRGSNTPLGRLLLPKGTLISPAQVGVLATVGKSTVTVFAAPSIAILATGDELVEIDQAPTGSQIRNSNLPMLRALFAQLGCIVVDLGTARDDPETIRKAIQTGLSQNALFITGGMSMGAHDYVPRLLCELGLDLKISKLRIKPGKPFVFGIGKHPISSSPNPAMVFGVPGNPVSAFVCTIRLASRILSRLSGGSPETQIEHLSIVGDIPANGPRETYLPAHREGNRVEVLPWTGSADLFTLARANALIIRGENSPPATAGELLPVMLLR